MNHRAVSDDVGIKAKEKGGDESRMGTEDLPAPVKDKAAQSEANNNHLKPGPEKQSFCIVADKEHLMRHRRRISAVLVSSDEIPIRASRARILEIHPKQRQRRPHFCERRMFRIHPVVAPVEIGITAEQMHRLRWWEIEKASSKSPGRKINPAKRLRSRPQADRLAFQPGSRPPPWVVVRPSQS